MVLAHVEHQVDPLPRLDLVQDQVLFDLPHIQEHLELGAFYRHIGQNPQNLINFRISQHRDKHALIEELKREQELLLEPKTLHNLLEIR